MGGNRSTFSRIVKKQSTKFFHKVKKKCMKKVMSEKSQKRVEKSAWKLCPGPPCGGEAAWPTALPPSGAGGGVVLRVHLAIPTGASGYRKSFTLWNRSHSGKFHIMRRGHHVLKGLGGPCDFFTLWKIPHCGKSRPGRLLLR